MAKLTIDADDFKHAATALEDAHFKALAGQTMGAVLRQSGNIIRRHIRAKVAPHRRSGKVGSHIEVRTKGTGMATEVTIAATSKVAHLLESGAAPHEIGLGKGSGQLGGGGKAMTIRGGGASNSAFAGFGAKSVRGAGADVLALRTRVHHPGMVGIHFFALGAEESERDVQARVDKGAATMKRNLEYAISRRT